MRELTIDELDRVSGGDSLFGITNISQGLKLTGVIGAVSMAASAGYAAGEWLNGKYEESTGSSIGSDLYDAVN